MSADSRPESSQRPPTARVFFALWPPAEIVEFLTAIARDAASRFGGRATRAETIHLTLAFLGDVPEPRLDELCSIASGIRADAFPVTIDSLAYWQHNRLLWAGCQAMVKALEGFQHELQQALLQAGFKVDGAARAFAPHLTLVRKMPPPDGLPELAERLAKVPLRWVCEQFVLVRSLPQAAGAVYQNLADFPLRGVPGLMSR